MTEEKINHRYQTLLLYEQGLLSAGLAASSIRVKERQFFKILRRFRESGRKMGGLKYQSHPAWNRTERGLEEKILKLAKDYPLALNSHLSWLAWDLYQLKIEPWTCRNILIREGKYVPFKEKQERAYKRFTATHFGALVQLDTKDGYWLRGFPLLHLILALDDASRTVLGGRFFYHDSTLNNMLIIKEIIRKYGIPPLFYTDNDSKFRVIRHGKSLHQNYQKKVLEGEAVTQIRRALAEVGSGLITHLPYHPQAKGKIEKLHRFIQDCFLRNQKAQTLEELNQSFKRWLNWYDSRNHRGLGIAPKIVREKLIREKKVAFRPLKKNLDLDTIFSVQDERKPNKYNIFSYQGKEYQLPLEKVVYPGKVELRIMPDNRIKVFNKEKELIAELKS
jgi:hypothetical protein